MLAFISVGLFAACSEDSPSGTDAELRSETYNYAFNEGQALGDDNTAYRGEHERNLTAELLIEEMENGDASITVTLNNTLEGESYAVHSHDAADPETTPNGTPYNETQMAMYLPVELMVTVDPLAPQAKQASRLMRLLMITKDFL